MPRPVPPALLSHASFDECLKPIERLTRLLQGEVLHRLPPATIDTRPGLTFTGRDHLGLSSHPTVLSATLSGPEDTAQDCTAHTALESLLSAALRLPGVVTFASATDAVRHTFKALLTPDDQVLLDAAVPTAVLHAAEASGATLHRFPAGSLDAVERRLTRLVRQPRRGRLVIAVPAVSASASRIWDLSALCALARDSGALLVVDASQDIGTMGQNGGGVMELQGCLGQADIVLGSLANGFGAAGGFAAVRDPDLLSTLRSSAQAPSQASARVLDAAAGIVFSDEGAHRRRLLHRMALRLRNHLMADGAPVIGNASPLVPILLPASSALQRAAMLESAGPRVTLLQAPDVPRHAPRWRIELSALHGPADIDDLAELIRDVTKAFDRAPIRMRVAV